jgi:hypothetical protein
MWGRSYSRKRRARDVRCAIERAAGSAVGLRPCGAGCFNQWLGIEREIKLVPKIEE